MVSTELIEAHIEWNKMSESNEYEEMDGLLGHVLCGAIGSGIGALGGYALGGKKGAHWGHAVGHYAVDVGGWLIGV